MKQSISRLIKFFSRPAPFIVLLVGLSATLRSLFLTKADIWHDEGYSTAIINYPLGEIISRTIIDFHPPFYYLLLSVWQSIFGSSVVSLRGLSLVCGVLTVVLLYMLMRRLFPEKIAKLAAIFAAFGPFLVRYSDEARMYSLGALIAVLSTYLLVVALSKTGKGRYWWWVGYGVVIALGLYTQYYLLFLIPAHIVYALSVHKWNIKKLIRDGGWWLGNSLGAVLFLPWLPFMLSQTSRVQEGYWIPPINLASIPGTISNFVTYNNDIATIFGYSLLAAVIAVPLYIAKKQKKNLGATLLLICWMIVPIAIVATLSLGRPVYIDRYFTYVAPAFYALSAVAISAIKFRHQWLKPTLITAAIALFIFGICNVSSVATHKMSRVAEVVNSEYQPGDAVISAELYTYFDFSYYNQTGTEVQLLSKDPFGKYGEMSLLHDKPHLRVESLDSVNASRIWVVGKVGEKDYYTTEVPESWSLISTHEAGDSAVRLYASP